MGLSRRFFSGSGTVGEPRVAGPVTYFTTSDILINKEKALTRSKVYLDTSWEALFGVHL